MSDPRRFSGTDVDTFILEQIDSVPHLEALMLLWNSRPVGWSCDELASRLYLPSEKVQDLLRDLVRLQVVTETEGPDSRYAYCPRSQQQNDLMLAVDSAYRRDTVRISTMIHSNASSAVREFARAFRFKKERE